MSDIIEISRLSKRFGDVQAVNDLSFRVKEGELFAFLGINGAGKSTTINIMCGQLSKAARPCMVFRERRSGSVLRSWQGCWNLKTC